MRYDMHALKKIGEIEDSLRERLGEIYSCDPDDLPIDFDLNDIYGAPSEERVELLTEALRSVPADLSGTIQEICVQLETIAEESKTAEKKKVGKP
eukprot:CAMPEP_0174821746 /NCGR_PEP_ID=MMETSP1107-20130205/9241_1 /TAXON_ID=36770 /ORGANISM="Paraphysomonas vestita, Strain GFlagA" /LENGTH=94 /DNA_ID=CAMNT_0016039089 /DNA_START=132 /DNA_END=416 /DNA_ORIENTATION=-